MARPSRSQLRADEIAVDVGMGGIVATIPVGREPYGVTLSPDGKLLYASNKVDNTIHVIDTATRKRLSVIGGFNEPRQAIVFSKDGQQAYVLNRDLSVSVVDTRQGKISHTLNAPSPVLWPRNAGRRSLGGLASSYGWLRCQPSTSLGWRPS